MSSFADRLLFKAKRVLEVGSEAADVLVHLQGGPSALGITAVGMRVINSIREHRASTPQEHFASWRVLELGVLATQALTALGADPEVTTEVVSSVHDETPAVITTADGVRYGWSISGSLKDPKAAAQHCWIQKDVDPSVALQRIGRALWSGIDGACGQLVTSKTSKKGLRLVSDTSDEVLPSRRGDELYKRIADFAKHGHSRSIFVVGEPGSGKSCMLRYIASKAGGFRLRFRLGRYENVDPSSLIRVVEILRPDVLIVDDFDRFVMGPYGFKNERHDLPENSTAEGSAMLDPLDIFNRIVPLMMVSANFSKSITRALLRPGRFDELEELVELDPDIYERMLPSAPPGVVRQLKRLKVPVVYIEELKKRVDVLGYEGAAREMRDLVKRTNRVIRLNEKKTKKRASPRSLVGKTPLQKAAILDRRAAAVDSEAARMVCEAEEFKKKAAKVRQRAQQERDKAKRMEQRAKAKKTAKKKAPTKGRADRSRSQKAGES